MPSRIKVFAHVLIIVFAAALPGAVRAGESQSLETLLAYLKSPDAGTRRDSARRLGERRVRDQLAVEALVVAARKDEDSGVRAEAVEALGKIKDFSALTEMLDALKDEHPDVRLRSVRALVMLYTEHDIDFITSRREGWNRVNPFLDTSDREIIEPYIAVDPEIIAALGGSARGDGDRSVRVAAIRALGSVARRERDTAACRGAERGPGRAHRRAQNVYKDRRSIGGAAPIAVLPRFE